MSRKPPHPTSGTRQPAARKLRVRKLPPESEAARDEGPRLIPLPDARRPAPGRATEPGQLPMNRYVALADRALRLWNQAERTSASDAEPAGGKSSDAPAHKPKR